MLQPPVCDGNAAATIGGGGSGGGAPPQPPLPTGGGGSPPQSPPPQPAQPSGAEFGSPTDINSSGDYGSGPVPNAPQPPPQAYTSAPASGGGYGGGSGGGSGGYASSGPSYTAAPFPNTPYSAQTFKVRHSVGVLFLHFYRGMPCPTSQYNTPYNNWHSLLLAPPIHRSRSTTKRHKLTMRLRRRACRYRAFRVHLKVER
jgi:hypothetical protein